MDDCADGEMAEAVVRYLAEHPAAMDTLDGIAQWWLMRQVVRTDLERLQRVLTRLADTGVLEAVGQGESVRYRLRGAAPGAMS